MPAISVPSVRRLVEEIDTLPNAILERAFTEAKQGGIKRFGVRRPVHPEIIKELRSELNRRNFHGNYIYYCRAERMRLQRHQASKVPLELK